jgi:NAD(P)-dependent dehydrogenase (short-subunit alcohol dehydrogenase family)
MTTKVKKALIVTGGSRGIGAATSIKAAQMGYSVCVNYAKNSEQAENVVRQIHAQGGKAIAVQADISSAVEVERLFMVVDGELGELGGLVNNAGISGARAKLLDLDIVAIKHIFEVNLLGYFYCAKEALKRMSLSRGGGGGAIVNVSSQAAQFGGNGLTPYAASKAAINNFTMALSKEVGGDGVRVNAVSPGIIETDQHDFSDNLVRKKIAEQIPLGRVGTPDDVATAILWLLSVEADYLTGVILPVSGGR